MICVKKIQSFGFKKKNFFFFFTKIKFECSSKHSNIYFVKKKEEEEEKIKTYKWTFLLYIILNLIQNLNLILPQMD